jgi:hypothetical protein
LLYAAACLWEDHLHISQRRLLKRLQHTTHKFIH